MHVWDRTAGCQLHSTCEDVQGLLPVLAWQPNGRHLYTIQQPHAAQQQRGGVQAGRRGLGRAAKQAPASSSVQLEEEGGGTFLAQAEVQQQQVLASPHVMLYERNGLKHGGFPLRARGPVAAMEWSSDSELLAVLQLVGGAARRGGEPCTGEQAEGGVQVGSPKNHSRTHKAQRYSCNSVTHTDLTVKHELK